MPCLLIVILSSTISVVKAGTVGRRGEDRYFTRVGRWFRIVGLVVVIVIVGLWMVTAMVGVGVHIRRLVTVIVGLEIIIVRVTVTIVGLSIIIV